MATKTEWVVRGNASWYAKGLLTTLDGTCDEVPVDATCLSKVLNKLAAQLACEGYNCREIAKGRETRFQATSTIVSKSIEQQLLPQVVLAVSGRNDFIICQCLERKISSKRSTLLEHPKE